MKELDNAQAEIECKVCPKRLALEKQIEKANKIIEDTIAKTERQDKHGEILLNATERQQLHFKSMLNYEVFNNKTQTIESSYQKKINGGRPTGKKLLKRKRLYY